VNSTLLSLYFKGVYEAAKESQESAYRQILFYDILFVEESCPFFFLKSLTPLTRNKRN
jgi:hypothetical protein